jgi:hypothetical protein
MILDLTLRKCQLWLAHASLSPFDISEAAALPRPFDVSTLQRQSTSLIP